MAETTQEPPQQYAPQPYGSPYKPAPKPTSSRPWHLTKIVLYTLSIIFSVVVLGISIALVVNVNYQSLIIVWAAPPAIVAICWGAAELITICARKAKRGIHPGAHVALHLILWLVFAVADALTVTYLVVYSECDYYCQRYDEDNYLNNPYIGYMRALVAFLSMLLFIHFFLFVRACVETAVRNSFESRKVIIQPVYYPAPPGMQQMPPNGGHLSMPVPPQQAHYTGYYAPTAVPQPKEMQHQATGSAPANGAVSGVDGHGHDHISPA